MNANRSADSRPQQNEPSAVPFARNVAADGNFAVPQASSPLAFTGERMTGAISGQIEFEHLHRYCLARDLAVDCDVLDVASGEGYGAALLAAVARSVTGVEIDQASVAHAQGSYPATNLRFLCGDAGSLPLPDSCMDLVVSFETVEHVANIPRFIDEIMRVLRPDGLLVMSTPDRTVYSAPGTDPNPYHVLEMNSAEFHHLLEHRFGQVRMLSQRPVLGSVMASAQGTGWRSYERRSQTILEASPDLARAPYLIALASTGPLPNLPSSVYLDHRPVHATIEAADRATQLAGEFTARAARHDKAQAVLTDQISRLHDQLETARHEQAEAAARHIVVAQELATAHSALEANHVTARLLAQERERTETLEREAEQQNRHADHLRALLAERAESWERVHVVLAARHADVERLSMALARAEDDREALRNSVSWRISRPIRIAGRILRRLRHAARLPQRAIQARATARRNAAAITALRATRLFDAVWYAEQMSHLPDTHQDAATHFVWIGAAAGLMPNPYFDTGWYCARYPEVIAGGDNPLLHWINQGAARRYDPNPFLRAAWYAGQHPEAEADPLLHWIEHGVPKMFDPNPMLDAEAYLLEYPQARDSGLGALRHWWHHGSGEGLNPHPAFDAVWYRQQHGLAASADPLAHWLETGQPQGLATSPLPTGQGQTPATIVFSPDATPLVSIIVPAYRHYADTWRCLNALGANTDRAIGIEVIVADDSPEHRIVPLLERRTKGIRMVQNPHNLGFVRSCNAAEKLAVGKYVVFLNNDAVVHPGWLEALVNLAESDASIGMVGCKMLNSDGSLQEAGGTILRNGWGEPFGAGDDPDLADYNYVRDVDVVVGACFLVRRAAFDAVGGFDELYAPAFYEEFDLAFALRQQGMRTVYQPASRVTHRGSNSYGAEVRDRQSRINHARFCEKWATTLLHQPAASDPPFLRRQRPSKAGTILVIDDRIPEWNRNAGALTIHQYIDVMRKEGYRVVFGAAADPTPSHPYMTDLQQAGTEVLLGATAIRSWLRAHGRQLAYVWISRPDVAAPMLPAITAATDAPVLYYTHDLHYLREQRRWALEKDPAALDESKRLMRVEHAIFSTVAQVMTPSAVEADIIRKEVPTASVHVIPPYILPKSTDPADHKDMPSLRDAVMFVGGFGHPPNVDAAIWLVTTIMPLVWEQEPDVWALVVGEKPPAEVTRLAGAKVEVTGFVADLAPVYARAVCTVSPLRYGAGIKGKVIGSLQAGVPVVTTSTGNEGIDLRHGTEALIADTAPDIADAILLLWRDRERASSLGVAGLAHLRESYSAEAAAAAFRRVIAATRSNRDAPHRQGRSQATLQEVNRSWTS